MRTLVTGGGGLVGPYEVKIEMAEICVALRLNDVKIAHQIVGRYADFLSPSGTPEVTVQVEVQDGAQFVPIAPGPWVISSSFRGHELTFESYFEAGTVNMATGGGRLLMAPQGSVENFLRVLYAWRCIDHGALLLHSSGVVNNNNAFVFFGPSGSGKTTTAHLSLDHTVLSDDLVIVKKANGVYRAYGVPFRGHMPEAPRSNASAGLQSMFCLRKDTRHFIVPLSYPQALAELVSCVPFVMEEPAMSQRAMHICADLAASVPVRELHFRRDGDFWRVIDEIS